MDTDNGLLALLDDRAATYGLLARLLGLEVDAALLAALADGGFAIDTGSAAVDEGARLMGGYLQTAARADADAARTELAVDFARLFVVRTRNAAGLPYPFESVYTSDDGCTMGAARDEVRRIYREAGMAKDDAWNVGEDHVALELEFAQTLAARTAQALREGDEAAAEKLLARQAAFMDAHLLNWVPRFADAMARTARTDFYRGLARFLAGWLQEDRATLAELGAQGECRA